MTGQDVGETDFLLEIEIVIAISMINRLRGLDCSECD